jgi:hypothetical protein
VFRHKDVPGISALHHSLRSADSGAGYVCPVINISNLVDRAAMNSHPQFELWMFSYLFGNVDRTMNWCFRTIEENQRHAVAHGEPDQVSGGFRITNLFGATDDPTQLFLDLPLLVQQPLRIADHVHEKDVADR